MKVLQKQELESCIGGVCSFAGVTQELSIIFVSIPLIILSGILMLVYLRRKRKNPQVIEKVSILTVVVWTIVLSLFASIIAPILI
jgi:hypothetical protein